MQGVEDHLASDDMDPVPFPGEDVDRWTTVGGPRRDSVTVEILLQPALLLLTFATLVVNLVGQTSRSMRCFRRKQRHGGHQDWHGDS